MLSRFPDGSDGKESACNAGDLASIPELGRSPGEGNCYPLQCSGLENSMDRGAWQATVHGVTNTVTKKLFFCLLPNCKSTPALSLSLSNSILPLELLRLLHGQPGEVPRQPSSSISILVFTSAWRTSLLQTAPSKPWVPPSLTPWIALWLDGFLPVSSNRLELYENRIMFHLSF